MHHLADMLTRPLIATAGQGLAIAQAGRTVAMAAVLLIGACAPGVPGTPVTPVTPGAIATERSGTATAQPSQDAELQPPGTLRPLGPLGQLERATLVRVVDGDTIVVDRGQGRETLRYIGIDTPETVRPSTPVEFMGPEATAANTALLADRELYLERDVSDTDRFGRLLRNVWLRDTGQRDAWVLVGLELVAGGWAQVTTFPPDVRYVDELLAAQASARRAALGLWANG